MKWRGRRRSSNVTDARGKRVAGRSAGLAWSSGPAAAGLGAAEWLALVLIPVAGVLLAAMTARLTVLATLRRMP